ncbi:hypothetical protein GIB67_015532 [Kingdonia uniflora]|uniref:Uncharacterized protein n=1 Tax=Kingdonia uniflora TaxID=39325 RepID=A0A7J7LAB2_9MAGN|nr:hypothetical protein GIB67_015532 [Kingdonia uniflora]
MTAGITGLSFKTFKDNWSSDYQRTNSAGVPDVNGKINWNYKFRKIYQLATMVKKAEFQALLNSVAELRDEIQTLRDDQASQDISPPQVCFAIGDARAVRDAQACLGIERQDIFSPHVYFAIGDAS